MSEITNKDGLDWLCERFMLHLRKIYSGHKAEISAREYVRSAQKFALAYGMKENELLQALIIRNWLEPSAADTYLIRYDLVKR